VRVKKLKNVSSERITVVLKNGTTVFLPSGVEITDVEITNEKELRGRTIITADLTEIVEKDRRTTLND